MAIFKLAVKYTGSCDEEIIEFNANSVSSARARCEEIVRENEDAIKKAEDRNIYVSRRVSSCRLCEYDFRLEMLGCEVIAELTSKNEI